MITKETTPNEEYTPEPPDTDDSSRSCKDCPPGECTGNCMSCYYRTV